ncbi:phospholipase D-like domain-containing protein [Mesorhizobium sp.]|uniref:phospholipase D-like domain-containing protein n=1 Tax=Mesorhizobium sp. TaxID=1871066 RepID=UPI000FE69EBE|nr:phospholipase D-like domain-containing protein [Mesorhizobium sp.]RWA58065.1 MAG: phosphatidylserine synthase [Mesorhizobium sp.]
MKYLYVPLYRMAVSYLYSFGRRWSIIEHMLLIETTVAKRTALELAELANVPHRLVVEALINLLRSNWIEVRSDNDAIYFAATPAGQRLAQEKSLPERLQKDIRWDSVCVERLTGHWMRADDLDLVYEKDLSADAVKLPALLHTFEPNDAALRDLFRLNLNESLEPTAPQFRTPSLPYARVGIAFNEVQTGLSLNAPLGLRETLVRASAELTDDNAASHSTKSYVVQEVARDDLTPDDIIVGGPAHLALLRESLERAKSAAIIHSCFLSAETLRSLLPDLERAARRKVRVELLWGLHVDPEAAGPPKKFSDAAAVLSGLPTGAQSRVHLSPHSSGSHAKVLIYDDRETGQWVTVVGSCNFLSSDFDWMEVSLRTRSALYTSKVLSRLLSNQLPAVGNWSSTARRLNSIWSELKQKVRNQQEAGKYSISLVTDHDHYACVTLARDHAVKDIEITCDLYGLSAETSVLVPMETAAARGICVQLEYTRPSKFLLDEGHEPIPSEIEKRGIKIARVKDVHAKCLGWDEDNLVISSFNWMATTVDGRRSLGAEIGALIEGPGIRKILTEKLRGRLDEQPDQGPGLLDGAMPS